MNRIDIILVTFNRHNFLKKTVEEIYKRTKYPYRLWVVDNASTDNKKTSNYLKSAKLHGFVHDIITMPENLGLAAGYTEGLKKVESKFFITTQDDCVPPDLKPCWLERMVHLMEKYEEDYAGISMRIQRMRHRKIDEFEDLIESKTSLASVFRIQSKAELDKVGGFGKRLHWESTSFVKRLEPIMKKYGVATHIYADHTGFMPKNKGFEEGFEKYHTYSRERINQGEQQPYPIIDEKSNIPLEIVSVRDSAEHNKRQEYYDYWGRDDRTGRSRTRLVKEQKELAEYCKKGLGLDLGCGWIKCHDNALGMDVFPHKGVDIVGDCSDLWMFQDNELDFIVSSHLLEHLPDTIEVLKEWKRVLKPGGILGIAVPDGEIKPKYILPNGHKVNLGLKTLDFILRRRLGMKIIRAENVDKNNSNKHVALIVVKKK